MNSELDLENFINIDDDDEDGNVQLTSAQLLEMMEEIWINEKFAPEILPNKLEVVDCVLGQISSMEKNLETMPCTDFKKGIYQLEVDRIRYLVTSYLRHRLEKIETYVFCIFRQEEQRVERGEDPYLTEEETQFAIKYKEALEQHFENVTNFYPGLPIEDWKTHLITPNMNSFVFLKAKNAVEGVTIGRGEDGDLVDLNPDSQMIISYKNVTNLVKKNDVQLI